MTTRIRLSSKKTIAQVIQIILILLIAVPPRHWVLSVRFDQGNHYLGRCPELKKLPLDKRLEIVKKHSLCFNCFYKHKLNDCRSEKRCMQDNFGQKHHSSLHREKSGIDSKNPSQKPNNVEVEQRIINSPDADDSTNPDSLSVIRNQLQYMPVTLLNGKTSNQCYAMLDNCSSCSYICKTTAEELNSVPKQSVDLKVHGAFSTDKNHSTLISLSVGAFNSTSVHFTLPNVYSVDKTHFDVVNVKQLNNICSNFNHLSHINYPELDNNQVRVLLGVDAFWFIAEIDIMRGPVGSPFAIRNLLGWTITGPLSSKYLDKEPREQQTNYIDARNSEQPTLSKLVEKLTILLIFLLLQIQGRSINYLKSWKTVFTTMEKK